MSEITEDEKRCMHLLVKALDSENEEEIRLLGKNLFVTVDGSPNWRTIGYFQEATNCRVFAIGPMGAVVKNGDAYSYG